MDSTVHAARILMGDSLGFHIIFVLMGLTLPILVSWFELTGIVRKDQRFINVAKFWSKIMALLVITGVVSGTIIALQMSLVWPGILKFGGEVIGLPFMFETYAFLIEATFLALYLRTWGKVKPMVHWLFSLMIIVGSTLSAYAITSVNAWMNYPSGFDYISGKIENVNVWAAMFSRTSIVEFVHSMPGYYLSAALIIAGMYAFRIARSAYTKRTSKNHEMDWFIIKRLMLFAGVMFILSGITADITGKYLAKYEAVKLAAIELNYTTRNNAPLTVGGVGREDGTIVGPHFEIPGALSLLAGNSTDAAVEGLNVTPKDQRPPLFVHTLFDVKMTLVNILMVLIPGYFVVYAARRKWLQTRPVLYLIGISGFIGIAIVELGWMLTEIGRQPWAVRGFVTTEEAFTKSDSVTVYGYAFPIAYVLLFFATFYAIKRLVAAEKSKKGGTLS
ncbi:cytochrome ubiquinol oxidase subunit I [Candidatus Saccharibacteria bacterium]|nr:cytochrome ubiquinol oxidase subunit I [Candidatus Saccharibacteria bacterium]